MATGNIIDIDLFGKQNEDGSAVEYVDANAINSAMHLFLSSKKGDFLYNPGAGGILDSSLFKVMNEEKMTMLQFNIRNNITNFFTPYVNLQTVNITPDYDNHLLEINVIYSISTGALQQTTVYVNSDFNIKHFEYTDVDYVGENLLKFCQIKKSDMIGQYMELDPLTDIWAWGGSYRFINLTEDDPYFEDILLIANS